MALRYNRMMPLEIRTHFLGRRSRNKNKEDHTMFYILVPIICPRICKMRLWHYARLTDSKSMNMHHSSVRLAFQMQSPPCHPRIRGSWLAVVQKILQKIRRTNAAIRTRTANVGIRRRSASSPKQKQKQVFLRLLPTTRRSHHHRVGKPRPRPRPRLFANKTNQGDGW